jgi:hypothetical protein
MSKGVKRIIFGAMLLLSFNSFAQTLNYQIASMYIYNFARYISWPKNDKNTEFVIGVYGNTPITDELKRMVSGKLVGQKPIVVKIMANLDTSANCSILFIAPSQDGNLKKISELYKGKHVLLICDKEGLSKKGASISIYLDEDDDYKTKFEMNKEYIEFNGLFISKSLIQLAAKVF